MEKTEAIVLNYINYTDSSIIINLLTKNLGKQTYIARGVRGKNSKTKINILQSMSIIDIDVKHKPKANINNLQEFSLNYFYKTIPTNIAKSSIVIFIAELLNKTIKEEEPDTQLYNFVKLYITELDNLETNYYNFHIIFLVKLSSYLGFMPNVDDNSTLLISRTNSILIEITNTILNSKIYMPDLPMVNNNNRNDILDLLIEFYSLHLQTTINIKSLDVLKAVFL